MRHFLGRAPFAAVELVGEVVVPASETSEERLVDSFRYRFDLPIDPSTPATLYAGTRGGGVFKSTNAGMTWTAVFDKVDGMMSIGAIAVAPSDSNVIYVGTGEACPRGDITHGDGIYKSTDGGKTWEQIGYTPDEYVAFYREATRAVSALPGATSVALCTITLVGWMSPCARLCLSSSRATRSGLRR